MQLAFIIFKKGECFLCQAKFGHVACEIVRITVHAYSNVIRIAHLERHLGSLNQISLLLNAVD